MKCLIFILMGILLSCISTANANVAEEIVIPGYSPSGVHRDKTTLDTQTSITIKIPQAAFNNPQTKIVWQNYLTALHNCSSSLYVLPQINPILAQSYGDIETDHIIGLNNGKCHVIMMYYRENDPRLIASKNAEEKIQQYPVGQECFLTTPTLQVLTAFNVSLLNGEEIKTVGEHPLSKFFAQECVAFTMVQGEKVVI